MKLTLHGVVVELLNVYEWILLLEPLCKWYFNVMWDGKHFPWDCTDDTKIIYNIILIISHRIALHINIYSI